MLGVKSYLDFVRYCIDEQQCVPTITDWLRQTNGWNALFLFMQQQALVGVGFCGLEKMKAAGVDVPREVVLKWYAMSEQIRQRNVEMNKKCVELTEILRKDGYESCILKGQGNAMMYPDPKSRIPGDIDVWVMEERSNRKNKGISEDFVMKVIRYAKEKNPRGIAAYHHMEYGDFHGVEVELHYVPTYMNSPINNRRMRKWIEEHDKEQFSHQVALPDGCGSICIPTMEFNIIYQLSHIYRHLFIEGIGLRQIIDYYYLLRSDVRCKRKDVTKTLEYLGLYKFACALMYILNHILGLNEIYLIVPMDKRRGEFLLEEILRGGNFGKYDTRGHLVKWNNPMGSFMRHTEHDLRMLRYFPSESLWEPVSRVYQFFWRQWYN